MKDPLYWHIYTVILYMPALLTLTILSSWRSTPAPPRLGCNKSSMGQVHHYIARKEQHCWRIVGMISKNSYLPLLPLGVVANNALPFLISLTGEYQRHPGIKINIHILRPTCLYTRYYHYDGEIPIGHNIKNLIYKAYSKEPQVNCF